MLCAKWCANRAGSRQGQAWARAENLNSTQYLLHALETVLGHTENLLSPKQMRLFNSFRNGHTDILEV